MPLSLLRRLAVIVVLIGSITPVWAEDDVHLRLNWTMYGSHAGFALGIERGHYADLGINLTIQPGEGSIAAHRHVVTGQSDFAYGTCGALVSLASQGAPLSSVAVIDAIGTDAILVRPDAGVRTIQSLKGTKLLTTANAGVNSFFPAVLANAGIPLSDVRLIAVPDDDLIARYLQGAQGAVGILGGLDDKPAEIRANGGDAPIAFAYSDYGITQVGYCLAAHRNTVAFRAGLVQRFVDATVRSYAAAEREPDTAIAALFRLFPQAMLNQTQATARDVLEVTINALYSKANIERHLGIHMASDWVEMIDLMKEYSYLEKNADPASFYTNQFVKE